MWGMARMGLPLPDNIVFVMVSFFILILQVVCCVVMLQERFL